MLTGLPGLRGQTQQAGYQVVRESASAVTLPRSQSGMGLDCHSLCDHPQACESVKPTPCHCSHSLGWYQAVVAVGSVSLLQMLTPQEGHKGDLAQLDVCPGCDYLHITRTVDLPTSCLAWVWAACCFVSILRHEGLKR